MSEGAIVLGAANDLGELLCYTTTITITEASSTTDLHDIEDNILVVFPNPFSNNINISILDAPECFSERAVPLESRNTYIENITKLSKFPVSVHYAMNFRNKIQNLIERYTDSVYDESLHTLLQAEITEQDSHRTLKLQDVDGFLYDWIYA